MFDCRNLLAATHGKSRSAALLVCATCLATVGCGKHEPSAGGPVPTLRASSSAADDYSHVPAQVGGRLEINLNLGRSKITDAQLNVLPIHDSVTILDLEQTAITDKGLENIGRGKNVEQLNLIGTKVTDACLPYLKQMPSLRSVRFDQTAVSTEAQLDMLRFLANRPEKVPGGQP